MKDLGEEEDRHRYLCMHTSLCVVSSSSKILSMVEHKNKNSCPAKYSIQFSAAAFVEPEPFELEEHLIKTSGGGAAGELEVI